MAVDIDALAVQITADAKNFERAFAKANGISTKAFNDMMRQAKNTEKAFDASLSRIGMRFKSTFAVVGAALGVNEVVKFSDSWTRLNNLMAASSQATGVQARSLSSLREGADDARTSLESYAELYARLMRSTEGVAKNEEEIARATNIVSKALSAGGASAQEASGAMLQLGQALGSGVLQGDELRSLRENAPILAKAIADEFGVTIAQLKQLGADGKLTSERVFKAILNAQKPIEAQFSKTNATIADGITRIKNAMTEFVGVGSETSGVAASVAAGLRIIADNFNVVASAGAILASLIATQLLGRSIIPLIARLKDAGVALGGLLKALSAVRNFSGVLAALGGPLTVGFTAAGIAVGAVALAVTSYQGAATEAKERTSRLNDEMEALGIKSKEAAKGIKEVAEAANTIKVDDSSIKKIQEITDEYQRLRNGSGFWGGSQGDELPSLLSQAPRGYSVLENDAKSGVEAIKSALIDLQNNVISTEQAIDRVEQARGFDTVSKKLQTYADSISKTLTNMKNLEEYGTRFGSNIQLAPVIEQVDELFNGVSKVLVFPQSGTTQKDVDDLKEKLKQGGDQAAQALKSLQAMFGGRADGLLESLGQVVGQLNQIKSVSGEINKNLANQAWVDFFKPVTDKVNQGVDLYKQYQAAEDYVKTQEAQNSKTKEQIKDEERLAEIRKNKPENITLTPDMENRILKSMKDKDERWGSDGKTPKAPKAEKDNEFDSLTKSIQERTAALKEEAGIQAQINPLANDYGYKLTKLTTLQKMYNDAQKDGVIITPEVAASFEQLAELYAQADVKLNKIKASQSDIVDKLNAVKEISQDVTRTFIDSMIDGKNATEALGDALMRLGQRLLDSGLNSVFDSIFSGVGGGSSGGGLSGILSALFGKKANGGEVRMNPNGIIRGAGGPRTDSIPTMLSNGEYVVNAAATKRNRALLEAINNGSVLHRADGGLVSNLPSIPSLTAMPQMPSLKGLANRNDVNVNASIKTSVDENGNLQAYVTNIATQVSAQNSRALLNSRDLRQVARQQASEYSANPRGAVR